MTLVDFTQQLLAEQDRWIAALLRVMEKEGESQIAQKERKQEIEEKWLCRGVWKRASQGLRLALEDLKGHAPVHELQTAGESILSALSRLTEPNQLVEKNLEKRVEQLTQAPNTLQELFGISDVIFEYFYQGGVRYYSNGQWKEAGDIFYCLSLLSPARFSVWLSLGMLEKKMACLEDALKAFAMAALLDPQAIMPHIYSAECYLGMRQKSFAEATLKYALELIQDASKEPGASQRSYILHLLVATKTRS